MSATCSLYLLRVPEFDALARELAATAGISVEERGDYLVARGTGEIVLHREPTGVGQAVWFGALTGGIDGRIVEFTSDVLRVAPLNPAQ